MWTILRVLAAQVFPAQVRLFAWKKEDKMFQGIVFVIYKLEEIIYSLDVMNCV